MPIVQLLFLLDCGNFLALLLVLEQSFQFLPHLLRAGIAVFRVEATGFQHDLRQSSLIMARHGQRFSPHPADEGLFLILILDLIRIGRHKGATVVVQQAVEDQTQGVQVYAVAVGSPRIDLRRHVGVRPLPGHAGHSTLGGAGDAEVA